MKLFFGIKLFFLISLFSFSATAEPDIAEGQEIWSGECQACHTIGEGDRVGPDMAGITDRREEDWLISFIKNSREMIEAGDEQAVEVSEAYPANMPRMDYLSDDEIRSVLAYVEQEGDDQAAAATGNGDADEEQPEFGAVGERRNMENTVAHQYWGQLTWIFGFFAGITVLVSLLIGYYIVVISGRS